MPMSTLEWKWDDTDGNLQALGTAGDRYVIKRYSPPNDWKRATYDVYRVAPYGKSCHVGSAKTAGAARASAQADYEAR
jgi:hypothetical protein